VRCPCVRWEGRQLAGEAVKYISAGPVVRRSYNVRIQRTQRSINHSASSITVDRRRRPVSASHSWDLSGAASYHGARGLKSLSHQMLAKSLTTLLQLYENRFLID